jgi:hypothetical protein
VLGVKSSVFLLVGFAPTPLFFLPILFKGCFCPPPPLDLADTLEWCFVLTLVRVFFFF